MASRSPLGAPAHVEALLERLHAESLAQEAALKQPGGFYERVRAAPAASVDALTADMMRDKFIALERPKALFAAHVMRATGALRVLELGTSYGVSTVYLATAVGQNAADRGIAPGDGRAGVVATEHEARKAERARQVWQEAGATVEPWIDLRMGDALLTLRELPPLDVVLFDIWTPMVLPLLKLVEPRLRPGAVLLADNTVSSAAGYADFFAYINAPGSGYTTLTLPYENGLEMTVYRPAKGGAGE